MSEETQQWTVPAVTLGYSVKQDPQGKFKFWNDLVTIIYRDNVWIAFDDIDPDRRYHSLQDAIEAEA